MYLSRAAQYLLLLLRISMGWIFIYDGYIKFTTDTWSILPLIKDSTFLPQLYRALSTDTMISILNQWYPLLLIVAGAMILTGLWMRIGSTLAVLLLIFIYLPTLELPLSLTGSFLIINQHIIYILLCLTLAWMNTDQFWGLGADIRINR